MPASSESARTARSFAVEASSTSCAAIPGTNSGKVNNCVACGHPPAALNRPLGEQGQLSVSAAIYYIEDGVPYASFVRC